MKKSRIYLTAFLIISLAIFAISCSDSQQSEIKFKIFFDSNGGTLISAQTVSRGEKAIKPADPIKPDDDNFKYEFTGWYDGESLWDFDRDVVTKETTLTAVYRRIEKSADNQTRYTVTFDSAGGTVVASRTVAAGATVKMPAIPKKNSTSRYDYEFIGWFFEDKQWDFDKDIVTRDIILAARYKIIESTVQYKPTE